MKPFDGKSQNLQMSPNIFFCASSYSFRNITILNYWRVERWSRSLRTIFLINLIKSSIMQNYLLWISNILHLDEWKRHTHTRVYPHTHTLTYTRAYIHKQGVALHILVSGISSEGVVYHHSDTFPNWTTAQVHGTLWKDCIAMSLLCCKREPFISFGNIKCLFTNFGGVKNWIFLKKVLSL